jgi:hypothetical protein
MRERMTNSFAGLPELLCLTDDAAEVAKFKPSAPIEIVLRTVEI